ncbi:hypothetical protein F5Y15DRAFT_279668 [Xylariaceae sp. FL0016]|nr:hypothetical protein F5Y15DRAFT_279668 [Xylariaceae sp. FL0016]
MFRISSITIMYPNGNHAIPKIQRSLSLKTASNEQCQAFPNIPQQSEASLSGHTVFEPSNASLPTDIGVQKEELERMTRISEQLVATFNTEAAQFQSELDYVKDGMLEVEVDLNYEQFQNRELTEEIRSPKNELKQIKKTTSNVVRISRKANQLETLQMEFKILKDRVYRTDKRSTIPETNFEIDQSSIVSPTVSKRKRASDYSLRDIYSY